MSRARALLRQILANPDDEQARAVYADLLQSEGDPRGELIAVDLELARAPSRALHARKHALLAAHGPRWWPALLVERIDVRRGFVARVAGTAAELEAALPMFDTEPIDTVELCDAHGTIAEAAWQRTIRHLAVRGVLAGDGVPALARRALAERLVSLDLGHTMLFDFAVPDDAFPRLRALSVADNSSLVHKLPTLVQWRGLGRLEHLDLRRLRLDASALLSIVGQLSRVRRLALSGNPIGPDGVFALARKLAELPDLVALELRGTGIGVEGFRALQRALPRCRLDADMPEAVELDLVGRQLRFEHCGGALWQALVDGEPRRIELAHSVQYDGGRGPTVTHVGSGMKVALEPLVRALANGAVRWFVGPLVRVERSTSLGFAYNTSVWTNETARLAFTATTLEVTFEEYIDTSS